MWERIAVQALSKSCKLGISSCSGVPSSKYNVKDLKQLSEIRKIPYQWLERVPEGDVAKRQSDVSHRLGK